MKSYQRKLTKALLNADRPKYSIQMPPINNDRVSVIQALMSGGKTYWAMTSAIPNLLKEGYNLISFFAPQTDLANPAEVQLKVRKACKQMKIESPVVLSEYDWFSIKSHIKNGDSVIVVTTNTIIFKEMRENPKNFGKCKWTWIGDEAHWGSTDNESNYRNNMGSTPPPAGSPNGFKARYYDFVKTGFKYTDRACELTATPTRQMKGEIAGNYSDIIELHTQSSSDSIKLGNTAWLNKINYINVDAIKDDSDNSLLSAHLREVVHTINERNNRAGQLSIKINNPNFQPKLSGMIICQPDRFYSINMRRVRKTLKELGPLPFDYIETDSKGGTTIYNGATHKVISSSKKVDWIELMNSTDNPNGYWQKGNNIKLVLCVGKGVMGVNIPGLVSMTDFNKGDQKSKDTNEPITNNPIQRFGRLVRHNNGYDYGYDRSLVERDLKKLNQWELTDFAKTMNTFDIYCYNNDKYSEASELFTNDYVYTFEKVNQLLK